MDVLLANPRGFCAGVERAIEIVERALELHGAPIYVRHEIVHNRFVVERLRAKGAVFVEELAEVTDDQALPKAERKRLQVEHAPRLSHEAKLVKLADKLVNLRDVAERPPAKWDLARRREYFDWAKRVVDGLRGTHPRLEAAFDAAYAKMPR